MAIRTITISEVPRAVRAVGASSARKHLLGLLNNPYLDPDQRTLLQTQLKEVSARESAITIPLERIPVTPREPQHHSIELVEAVGIKSKVS